MKYRVSIADTEEHFIKLEWKITLIDQDTLFLQLPSWRPGRYELQNYAKNIRSFNVTDEKDQAVPFRKVSKDKWEVDSKGRSSFSVTYEYYANQLDAGASFVSESMLYINPVNCFMYAEGRMNEAYEVELVLPEGYKVACQLPGKNNMLHARNFDELADSPFIASPALKHESFEVKGSTIHFWFEGRHSFNLQKLKEDTISYAEVQIRLFGDMPCSDYHFLYIMLPQRFHHGVEHADSTVIAMGQGEEMMDEDFYDEFISISSHEMFHLWNVKRIRPADMLPYDFTKENYSTLGYIYEGVTTYYGDLMLLRSRAWSWEQFVEKFNVQLLKHFSNEGRNNYSVAESSYDTWLDGYTPGVKGRKVSIYVEGMLAACIADILIIHHSKGKYSYDDVLRSLYHDFAMKGRGYTESDYRSLLEKFAGISFEKYFADVIWGQGKIEGYLKEALALTGCSLEIAKGRITLSHSQSEGNKLFALWTGDRQ